ncbi:DNA segregation ATPase FtsK/SpoIIIE, S-DNA-T family [Pseudobutyrivibrio sp. UC1225]|uniref:type VII secretion protein EssC n=1 Tax=Pseudobutyrivibrio sp. UC1225 TaxID=1798185 RepID=UPI0008E78C0C|nr:type VII secretion protein EssC [Pseudobutyrivibrio sp. UC1225]SFN94603.1 DNA segregation ATPase FtsK/SpoIIIE, S-DNA-T family [Pseudobutyrivibrio sp. UC1225]
MESNRYRIILSGKSFYKEIEISPDIQTIRVGTGIENDVRLNKEYFFEEFELVLTKKDNWALICSDNLYISQGDSRKLLTKEFSHGDNASICYQSSGIELFNIELLIDFDYEKKKYDLAIDLSNQQSVCIGGSGDCHVRINDDYIGNDSIIIEKTNKGYVVTDRNTKYGVRVDGIKINSPTVLSENDFVSFASFGMCLKGDLLYCDSEKVVNLNSVSSKKVSLDTNELKYPKFNRNPRFKSVLPEDEIEILDPPEAPQKPEGNIVLQLLPAILMLAVTVVLRGLMGNGGGAYVWISAISMTIGIVTSVIGIINARKKYKTDTEERLASYTEYIENKKVYIEECRCNEAKMLNDTYYSIEKEKAFVRDFSDSLFDRTTKDEDYLVVRLGNGNKEAVQKLSIKKKEELNCTDELLKVPTELQAQYRDVHNVPITLDLKKNNAVGVIGSRADLNTFIKTLTTDLAVRQYYTDTKLFYVLDEEDVEDFKWLRFLPHVKNEQLNMRNIVYDSDSRSILFDFLYKELSSREASEQTHPNYVIMVYRDNGIKNHPISKYIEYANMVGVSFIFFEEHKELLPSGCNSVVQLEGTRGIVTDTEDKNNVARFEYEVVNTGDAAFISNKLAPVYCEEVSLEGSLTKNITLFELMNILNVEDINLTKNWDESQVYKSMAAPLGVKSKSQVVSLDLNEKQHGPHGLVAGTTGSGKSEILQSYILSMATLFHPYDVGFVIIDFKGGGMVNQFKKLPHLIGAITNIDGREIDRSLSSIKAELRKRQALFAEHDVNHIDAYIKLFKKGEAKIPLPHLILIVDEFAELKMDQPEFMKELISAARIGRSLGVHLILATQKPSGVVDAQIWSNSKFKLCLKVQNKEDSNEVLKTPVAAEIKEPGRAYLQVGNNEIFELFQSAYSGAPATFDASAQQKPFTVYSLDLAGKHTPVYTRQKSKSNDEAETQLDAITNYIAEYCEENNINRLPGICLPPLEETIVYTDSDKSHSNIDVVVDLGIYDDPDNQYQGVAQLNISTGNTIIIGSSQYGKTNLLQMIIRAIATNYRPSEVNMYILDFASMALNVFADLNHVGGVISAADDEKLKNFIRMIRKEMARRKEVFAAMGITSFSSYKEAGNTDIPQIIIMVDNFLALKELYGEYEDDIINICREGVALGISLIFTSIQTSGISYKYMSNFANRICLYCNQSDEYSTVFDRCRMSPKNVPGRCLYSIDKTIYELQTYLAFEGEKEIDRVQKIKEFITVSNCNNPNERAVRIPEVPNVLNTEYVKENYFGNGNYILPVGIDYDSVDFVELDLLNTYTMGITGRKGYGKASLARYIVNYLQRNIFNFESKVYVIDGFEQKLKNLSSMGVVEKYTVDLNDFELILEEIEAELIRRMDMVKTLGFDAINNEPLLMVMVHNKEIFATDGISKAAVETYKRIVKTYKNMKLLFVFSDVENASGGFGASEMLKQTKEFNMMIAMEDIGAIKNTDIPTGAARQFKKPIETGDAYVIKGQDISKIKVVYDGE